MLSQNQYNITPTGANRDKSNNSSYTCDMNQFVDFPNKQVNPQLPGVMDIGPSDLLANRHTVCIVDVRQPEEYTGELGHIAGSRLLVLDTLPHEIASLPQDQTVVFVCRSGGRSARAAQFAMAQGMTNVFNLHGGMLLWHELQLPVEGQQ
jgi:rhodanese-related sulfurtransferase